MCVLHTANTYASAPPEQELHVLWCKLVHGHLVIVYRAVDHVGFLFLEHHDS